MKFEFAVIGCGLTGTVAICQLVRKAERNHTGVCDPSKIRIHAIEKSTDFGPGHPYSPDQALPFHLLNQPADRMSVFDDQPDDFVRWIGNHLGALDARYPDIRSLFPDILRKPDPDESYPRVFMGEYLKARFRDAKKRARRIGMAMECYPGHETVDIRIDAARFNIGLKNTVGGEKTAIQVDAALLSTGHWTPGNPWAQALEENRKPRYFSSPWPAAHLLKHIPVGESVGIIGSGLSAIDTVLTLTSVGRFKQGKNGSVEYVRPKGSHPIVLYSRNGSMPKVRGKAGAYVNRSLTRAKLDALRQQAGGELYLKDILSALNRDLTTAYGIQRDFNKMARSTDPPHLRLAKDIAAATDGDGNHGELLWQTVLHQALPMAREGYLHLAPSERERFDTECATLFLNFAAPMPVTNARKMMALLNTGVIRIEKLGRRYQLDMDPKKKRFVFTYYDEKNHLHRQTHTTVIDARGQNKHFRTSPSRLSVNLLKSGLTRVTMTYPHQADNGGVRIDPVTHRVIGQPADTRSEGPPYLYAVGALTGGQIIDVSNAASSVFSTNRMVEDLFKRYQHDER